MTATQKKEIQDLKNDVDQHVQEAEKKFYEDSSRINGILYSHWNGVKIGVDSILKILNLC